MYWVVYEVEIEYEKPVLGGIPKAKDVIAKWVESRAKKKGRPPEEIQKMVEKISDEVYISGEEEVERLWTTFKADENGLYIEDRNIKAMLREAATTLGYFRGQGSMQRKQTFQHGLVIKPYKVRFYRDGEVIKEPEATQERPVLIDYKGTPMAALKKEDVILPGARSKFYIAVIDNDAFKRDDFVNMLELCQEIGIGAARSQQFGKFRIIDISEGKRITTDELKKLNYVI